jgi:hypothetical protein
MALKITKGRQAAAVRTVIYGTEGIGKTTLAASFPKPLILDTEEGSRHLDCDRVEIHNWVELTGAVLELARDSQGYKTVVIDSADWSERLLIEGLLNETHKKSIEDFGFGKGYVMLQERVAKFLDNCDALVRAGINVVFVAHSKVQRTSPPDLADGFDRYELKLTKQVAPLFKEWCDLLLFCNYKLRLIDGNDGRKKAKGGKERVMYAERSAAWDAKNRFGLPEEMPMGIEALAPIFTDAAPAARPKAKPKSLRERIAEADSVAVLGEIGDVIAEQESAGKLTPEQVATLMGLINSKHADLDPPTGAPWEKEAADAVA